MGNLIRNDTKELIYKTETDSDFETKLWVIQRGNVMGREGLGGWDWHI